MGRICTFLKGLMASLAIVQGAAADEATLAVASNFLPTMAVLEPAFEAETGHDLIVAHGSTGRLYAQILSGAPFDIFLAADAVRPEALAVGGRATETETYALGRLVLVARAPWASQAVTAGAIW